MALVKTRPHYNVVFAVLLLGIGAYALLQSMIVPVLSILIPALHTTQDTATWLMTAYLLSASVATPILGRIGDKVGKERMLVATLVALTAGSLIAALTDSVSVMIVARVIQGLGGGVLPLAFGIIRDEFPSHKLNSAVGVASALMSVGAGLGLVLAGPIVDHLNYHWLFWVPMIMTAVAAVAAIVFVPESPVRSPGKINWGAALLLSAWLVALLLAVSKGAKWGWGSGRVLGLFAAAAVCLVVWIVVELKAKDPLIDMRTMRIPAVWATNLVAVLAGVAMYAMMTFLPQLLQTPKSVAGYGLSASITQSGIYMLPMTVTMFVLGLVTGRLMAAIGAKLVVLIGAVVMFAPFVLLALGHDQSWQIYVAAGVLGVGLGLVFSSMPAIIVGAVPPGQTGAATGMNANVRTVGGAIGSAVAGSILTSGLTAGHHIPPDSGYTKIFWFLAAACALAAVALMLIPTAKARAAGSAVAEQDSVGVDGDVHGGNGIRQDAATFSEPERVLAVAGRSAAANVNGSAVDYNGAAADYNGSAAANHNGNAATGYNGHAAAGYNGNAATDYNRSAAADYNGNGASAAAAATPRVVTSGDNGDARSISGVVHRENGQPVPGAALTLIDQRGHQVSRVTSGSDGGFRVGAPVPGSYVLIASASGHQPLAVPVTVGSQPQLLDLTLPTSGELSGVVRRAGSGEPVTGAAVTLTDLQGEVAGVAITGDDGVYVCRGVAAGPHTLVAVAEHMRPTAITLIVPDSGPLPCDIELEPMAMLIGSARAQGRAVPDAQVTVLDSVGREVATARTDGSGNYVVADLPEGQYTVVARGYPPVTSALQVTGGEITHDVQFGYDELVEHA